MEKKGTILIVEDERVNRKIIKRLLEDTYNVMEAENGLIAWEMFSNQKSLITAILLDIVMPVMNGFEFLEKLQLSETENMPIIVTTGSTDEEAEQKALDLGAWDFVTKPINGKVLLSRLRNAIARSELTALERLQYISEHDELTGLYNRRMMFTQTKKMIENHPEDNFLFVRFDIDRFALYNTSFGEKEGDALLKYMADNILKMAKLQPYYTCGRISADIFFMCGPFHGDYEQICERIKITQNQISGYRKDYRLEISTGICIMDDVSLPIDEYYFRTTIAASQCKNMINTPFAFYDSSYGEKIAKEVTITNEMQNALDLHQFLVYLQPKFELPSENICGAEALVRWLHPQNGLVSPGEFIPVFEKNGFIAKLDYFVWEETCRMLRDWRNEGKEVYPVSVNISRISLYNPLLLSEIVNLTNRYDIPSQWLQLEITESAYMTNPDLMEKTIESLHDAGFTILMDDFGSGYSSLNTLKRIKVDVLKVDMKFLPVSEETGRAEIILASVIKMAGWLGMQVVVEGVETRRQRDFLDSVGCDSIQGYYYCKPIPELEYEQRYLKQKDEDISLLLQQSQQVVPMHNMTILVIDDSEMDRTILYENLHEICYIQMLDSAEAGLSYLKHNSSKVRLIIVDNNMPGMSGLQFLHYCGLDSTLSSIPKIMITVDDTIQDQVNAFKEGAYDYITKPFVPEIVLARVRHIIELSYQSTAFDGLKNLKNEMVKKHE